MKVWNNTFNYLYISIAQNMSSHKTKTNFNCKEKVATQQSNSELFSSRQMVIYKSNLLQPCIQRSRDNAGLSRASQLVPQNHNNLLLHFRLLSPANFV